MADNTTLNPGTGGDVIASDDIGGVKFQRVKLALGADGTNNGDVSASNPIPIDFKTQTGGNVGVAIASILMSSAGANWTSADTIDSVFAIGSGYSASTFIALTVTGTISGGVVSFEGKDSSGNWYPIQVRRLDSFTSETTYTLGTGQKQAWQVDSSSYSDVRVRLSTTITGAGTAAFSATTGIAPTNSPLVIGQSAASKLNAQTQGPDAHDAPVAGNPILTAGRASAAAPTDVSADGDVVRAWMLRNGATSVVLTAAGALIPGDATNGLDVDVTRLPYDVAHDAADSGNPFKVGLRAVNALPTAVANADRANAIGDLWGRLMVTHIDPAQHISKSFNATTQQTGADVWSPTSGKKIAITSIVIGVYGTTAGRVILWFGDNADTTYTAGTDQLVLAFSAAPSSTSKPGVVFTPAVPVFCTTADRELHITTDAAMSIDVAVHGYEW